MSTTTSTTTLSTFAWQERPAASALAKDAEHVLAEIRRQAEHHRAALTLVAAARKQFDAGERTGHPVLRR